MTDLSERQQAALDDFLSELYRWNTRINLTSVPQRQAWVRHIAESLTLLEMLRPRTGATILDIGSGEGIPGIVIAIMRPDLRVCLLDSRRRKAGFLTHVSGILGLKNVEVANVRVEQLIAGGPEPLLFDYVVSRATASVPQLLDWSLVLLRKGGSLGALVADASQSIRQFAELFREHQLQSAAPDKQVLLLTKSG